MRGYFGVAIENCKKEVNVGGLFRSAQAFDANFMYIVGRRYQSTASDTSKAYRHIPLYECDSFDQFYAGIPKDCTLVGVEYPHSESRSLMNFVHPERAIYLLGSEDKGLSQTALNKCDYVVYIPTKICLNVATAGSIIMYDRHAKRGSV